MGPLSEIETDIFACSGEWAVNEMPVAIISKGAATFSWKDRKANTINSRGPDFYGTRKTVALGLWSIL